MSHRTQARHIPARDMESKLLLWLLHHPMQRIEDVAIGLGRVSYDVASRYMTRLEQRGLLESVTPALDAHIKSRWFYLSDTGVKAATTQEHTEAKRLAHVWGADEQGLLHLLPRFHHLAELQEMVNGLMEHAPMVFGQNGREAHIKWSWVRDYQHQFVFHKRKASCFADAAVAFQVNPEGQEVQPNDPYYSFFLFVDCGSTPFLDQELITQRLLDLMRYRECEERIKHRTFPLVLVVVQSPRQRALWQQCTRAVATRLAISKQLAGAIVCLPQERPAEKDWKPYREGRLTNSAWERITWRDLTTNDHCHLRNLLQRSPMEVSDLPPDILTRRIYARSNPPVYKHQIVRGKFAERAIRLRDDLAQGHSQGEAKTNGAKKHTPLSEEQNDKWLLLMKHFSSLTRPQREVVCLLIAQDGTGMTIEQLAGKLQKSASAVQKCIPHDLIQFGVVATVRSEKNAMVYTSVVKSYLHMEFADYEEDLFNVLLDFLNPVPQVKEREIIELLGLSFSRRYRDILLMMYVNPLLSTTELCLILDQKPKAMRRYLQVLQQWRFAQHDSTPDQEWRWWLADRGLRFLSVAYRVSLLHVRVPEKQRPEAHTEDPELGQRGVYMLHKYLRHTIGVYQFIAELHKAAQEKSNHRVLWWEANTRCERRYRWRGRWHNFRPDAILEYEAGEQRLLAWVEWDRGSMGGKNLRIKLETYKAYVMSGEWTRSHIQRLPLLLVIVPNRKQLDLISQVAREVLSDLQLLVRVTTLKRLEQSGPLARIWTHILPDSGRKENDYRYLLDLRVKNEEAQDEK